jgi:mRNA-degrading endonuclease RelE of RelBE toxin-antitoxin system
MAYIIEFAESVKQQLKDLTASQRALVFEAIEKQLIYEPLTKTGSKKLLRPNPVAPWELRISNLRVFYEVTPDEPNVVHVLAIGQKKRDKLFIAGKEINL